MGTEQAALITGAVRGWEKRDSDSLLELEAQVFACVRAEAAGALSKPDALGAVPAPIADLTVDLRLVSCDRGAVQSLPAGHCRRKEGQDFGVTFLPLPCPSSAMLRAKRPLAKNTTLIPNQCIHLPWAVDSEALLCPQMRKPGHRAGK